MSHNKIKVAGQEPNSNGEISLTSLTIGDLSNVTINSPSAEQVIKYDGSNYVNGSAPSGSIEYILIGQGESSAYSNSGASSLSANQTLRVYDTSPLNTISGASLTITNDWITNIILPAGYYSVMAVANVVFSASGYLAFGFMESSTIASHVGVIGDYASTYANGSVTCVNGYMSLSASSNNLNFEIRAVSNVDSVANQGTTISEFTSILITKLAT